MRGKEIFWNLLTSFLAFCCVCFLIGCVVLYIALPHIFPEFFVLKRKRKVQIAHLKIHRYYPIEEKEYPSWWEGKEYVYINLDQGRKNYFMGEKVVIESYERELAGTKKGWILILKKVPKNEFLRPFIHSPTNYFMIFYDPKEYPMLSRSSEEENI